MDDYDPSVVNPIATPLASEKLTKRTLKLVKKAMEAKAIRRGIKEVVKAIRKNQKGLVILAGNVSPIDVYSHLPVLCESNLIPYVYVPKKEQLGQACLTKRPTSVVLIVKPDSDDAKYAKAYATVSAELSELDYPR